MANKTVTFSGQIVSAAVLQDLKRRINSVYSAAGASTTTPTSGSVITFSDLQNTYNTARTAIFNLSGNFGSRSLSNFQGLILAGNHGIGIVEKTVGDLEQICTAYNNANKSGNFSGNDSFTSGNFCSTNYSGTNSGNCSFTSASQVCSGNCTDCTFTPASGVSFSGHRASHGSRRSFDPFDFSVFHTGQSGCSANKASVQSGRANNSSNFSGHSARNGSNKSFTAAQNSNNYSPNCPGNFSPFSTGSASFFNFGSFSTNRSFTTGSGGCFSNFVPNFASNDFLCKVVTFKF